MVELQASAMDEAQARRPRTGRRSLPPGRSRHDGLVGAGTSKSSRASVCRRRSRRSQIAQSASRRPRARGRSGRLRLSPRHAQRGKVSRTAPSRPSRATALEAHEQDVFVTTARSSRARPRAERPHRGSRPRSLRCARLRPDHLFVRANAARFPRPSDRVRAMQRFAETQR
jgi:hypothetical protein